MSLRIAPDASWRIGDEMQINVVASSVGLWAIVRSGKVGYPCGWEMIPKPGFIILALG